MIILKISTDSLEWLFVIRILDAFNFGSSIKRLTSTFNANVESAVFNDGHTTNLFKPSKGVRQGCPLSRFLFILSARLLFIKIRHDPGVKGNHPLDMKWMQTPVMILGAHFSYDKEENDDSDFSLKLRKLQTNWICGVLEASLYLVVLITTTIGISQIMYSA